MNKYLCVLREGMKPAIKEIEIEAKNVQDAKAQLKALDEPNGSWSIYNYL